MLFSPQCSEITALRESILDSPLPPQFSQLLCLFADISCVSSELSPSYLAEVRLRDAGQRSRCEHTFAPGPDPRFGYHRSTMEAILLSNLFLSHVETGIRQYAEQLGISNELECPVDYLDLIPTEHPQTAGVLQALVCELDFQLHCLDAWIDRFSRAHPSFRGLVSLFLIQIGHITGVEFESLDRTPESPIFDMPACEPSCPPTHHRTRRAPFVTAAEVR